MVQLLVPTRFGFCVNSSPASPAELPFGTNPTASTVESPQRHQEDPPAPQDVNGWDDAWTRAIVENLEGLWG